MSTVEQARAFIRDCGADLTDVGHRIAGWTVVHREYSWHKYSTVYFTVVASDPEGQLWQYTVASDYGNGTEVEDDPIPVSAVVETKQVVTYRPRLVPRRPATNRTN